MHHGLRSVALVATIAGLAAPPRTRTSELRTRMAQRPKAPAGSSLAKLQSHPIDGDLKEQ
jgi:hypothetical protein